MESSRPYCFQSGHPLGFAVQFRLTPELKQALINARASGEAVSLRFREEPHREAVLSIAGQEYFFSTAPQAGQVEVMKVDPTSKGATSVACVKQRLTLQRPVDSEARPRGLVGSLGMAGALQDDRKKRSVFLGGGQRGGGTTFGVQPRVTTTTEVVTRSAPAMGGAPNGPGGRFANGGMAALGAGSSLRPTPGSAPSGPRPGASKPMELPRPRSQQPNGGALVKPQAQKVRKTPTPPPPEPNGGSGGGATPVAATVPTPPAAGLQPAAEGRAGGGSGGGTSAAAGGGSSPVGYGGGGNGSGGGSAATVAPPPQPAPVELPRAALLAARRGDLPLVVAALLREQPLTATSLVNRIDQVYKAAGAKQEAREYVKRVIDNCCNMSANRMHLRPDVLAREGPRLDELVSGTSPAAGDTPNGAGGSTGGGDRDRSRAAGGGGRYSSAHGQAAAAKRMASCSPDPRMSPEQNIHHHSPGGGPGGGGRSSTEDAAATSGGTGAMGEEDDDGGSNVNGGHVCGPARSGAAAARQGAPPGAKRQKTNGAAGATSQQQQQQQQQRPAPANGHGGVGGSGRGVGGGLQGYEDFDDLADPPPVASAPPRENSGGRPTGQYHAGRATAAKVNAAGAKPKKIVVAPGGPRGLPSHSQLTSSSGGAAATTGGGPQAAPPQRPPMSVARPRPAASGGTAAAGGGSAAVAADSGAAGSPSPGRRLAGPPAKPAPVPTATAVVISKTLTNGATRPQSTLRRVGSEDGGGGGSESQMDTDGRCTTVAATATVVTASPDCESALDSEIQAYADPDLDLQEEDKDAEWYREYVDWKPQQHAAVQSTEQYEQYEKEYRHKFEVYHRLNQKYNEVVREADAMRAAVEAARSAEERHRCVLALWQLGATKWRLLEVWKRARRNLHLDLGDLRDRVAEYVARQGVAAEAAPQPLQPQLQPS